MADWLRKRAEFTPDRVALVDDRTGLRLTYAEMDRRAAVAALAFRDRLGLRPGDRLAVLAKNRPEFFIALFACIRLRAILVPINVRLAAPEVAYILGDSEPVAVLHDQAFEATLREAVDAAWSAGGTTMTSGRRPILVSLDAGRGWEELVTPGAGDAGGGREGHGEGAGEGEAEGEGGESGGQLGGPDGKPTGLPPDTESPSWSPDPCLILYTSGTTGRPKGAVLATSMLTWNAVNTAVSWDLSSADVAINPAPLYHTGGINVFSMPLFHLGGRVVLMEAFDAARVLELVEQERATVFFGVPTMLQMMVESPRFAATDLASLRWVIAGGATCPIPVVEAFRARGVAFRQGYGLTEVGPNCFATSDEGARTKPHSVGFPVMHSQMRVVDAEGRDVPFDGDGELLIKGPHAFAGYWRNPEATAKTITPDGWVHTGDVVRRDAEGFYYIVDRIKDMYKSGGENVYPLEAERVIERHPVVAEVAVIGVPDPKWDEVGRAYVVLRPGATLTLEELADFCRPHLARFKLPKQMVVLTALPRNATGKVQKEALRAMALAERTQTQTNQDGR